jgi:hypothetical protein
MVAAGVLKLVPLRTHLMVADALTKSLPSPVHLKHREIMLDHVPFSFAARTLRRSVGGVVVDPSLSLSTCRDARGEPQYLEIFRAGARPRLNTQSSRSWSAKRP